ncbi:hypothetical protein ACWU4D_04340 [Vibrio sp. WJH972]
MFDNNNISEVGLAIDWLCSNPEITGTYPNDVFREDLRVMLRMCEHNFSKKVVGEVQLLLA